MNPFILVLVAALPLLPLLPAFMRPKEAVGINPLRLIFWLFFVLCTLRYLYIQLSDVTNYEFQKIGFSDPYLLQGQLLLSLATLGLSLGYFSSAGKRVWTNSTSKTFQGVEHAIDRFLRYFFPVLAIIGIAGCYAYLDATGFIDAILGGSLTLRRRFVDEAGVETAFGFYAIGADILISIIIARIYLKRKFDVWSIALFLLVLVTRFAGGGRLTILIDIILIGIVASYLHPLFKQKILRVFYAVGAVAALLILVSGAIRNQATTIDGTNQLSLGIVLNSAENTLDQITERPYFLSPEKLQLIDQTYRQTDNLFWGKTFLGILWAPVPRTIWPEKPDVRIGRQIAADVYNTRSRSGVSSQLPGRTFDEFRLVGIFAGMLVIGILLARVQGIATRPFPAFGPLLYAVVIVSIPIQMFVTDFVGGIISLLSLLVPTFAAYRYFLSASAVTPRRARQLQPESSYGE